MTEADYRKRFTPDDFRTDDHYWSAFDHMETEVSARWVVMFLQARGRGWEDFTIGDIRKFYAEKRREAGKPDDRFTFNHLTVRSRPFVSAGGSRMIPNKVSIQLVPEAEYDDATVCTVLSEFIARLVYGRVLKDVPAAASAG